MITNINIKYDSYTEKGIPQEIKMDVLFYNATQEEKEMIEKLKSLVSCHQNEYQRLIKKVRN